MRVALPLPSRKGCTIFVLIIENLSFNFATIYQPALSTVMSTVFKKSYSKCAGGGTAPTLQSTFESNADDYNEQLKALEAWFGMGE